MLSAKLQEHSKQIQQQEERFQERAAELKDQYIKKTENINKDWQLRYDKEVKKRTEIAERFKTEQNNSKELELKLKQIQISNSAKAKEHELVQREVKKLEKQHQLEKKEYLSKIESTMKENEQRLQLTIANLQEKNSSQIAEIERRYSYQMASLEKQIARFCGEQIEELSVHELEEMEDVLMKSIQQISKRKVNKHF